MFMKIILIISVFSVYRYLNALALSTPKRAQSKSASQPWVAGKCPPLPFRIKPATTSYGQRTRGGLGGAATG